MPLERLFQLEVLRLGRRDFRSRSERRILAANVERR